MEIDFGGFGKEYAADQVARVLQEAGVSAGYVNLGGDVASLGVPSGEPPWVVGVAHPDNPRLPFTTVPLARGAVATSGDYERSFVKDGRRYSHILNPHTGQPTQGIRSVTVYAATCLIAGTSATIALSMGPDAGRHYLDKHRLRYLMVHDDYRVVSTMSGSAPSRSVNSVAPG